jgi:RimJ/RimL family protein N-acetyltransferase
MRPWRDSDAATLQPVLESNRAHLEPWIPARVSRPAPIDVLSQRLAAFGADFAADREWRYAIVTKEDNRLLGEVGLYPRNATRRAPFTEADRVELGYWLRSDVTGRGYATEASGAMLEIASALPRFTHAEIRCDARNESSAGIPRRLGFELSRTISGSGVQADADIDLQVWKLALPVLQSVTAERSR